MNNSRKSVGILTYHTGYNYGASLQAYALSRTISKLGYSCEIINFETEKFVSSREMFSRKPTRLKEIIKIIARLPYFSSLKVRQKMFDQFTNSVLPVSSLYRTENQVIDNAKNYKCIVCGSDQIWNLSNSDAPAANLLYFLNFPKNQRRISYAASFGKWVKEADSFSNVIVPLIKKFDYVSVREKSGEDFLKAYNIDCHVTIDPTFLLDKQEYDNISSERLISYKYILFFSWSCGKNVINIAKKISNLLSLPLICITPPPRALFSGIKRKLDVGPCEFLSMVKHAEFVVTDSFHGTAFSTNFEKPFVSVVSDGKADPRMLSLLQQLNLQDHLISDPNFDINSIMNTDYTSVKVLKQKLVNDSLIFLKTSLQGI